MITLAENIRSEYLGEKKDCFLTYLVGMGTDELHLDIAYYSENGKERFVNHQAFVFRDENLEKFLEVIEKTKKVKALFLGKDSQLMEASNEQYTMFVYNMLNPLAEARCEKYRLLTHAVMGLISEFQEFKQAMSLAEFEFDTDIDDMTPEGRQLIRDAELEAADMHFFATLFKTEMANLFQKYDDRLAKNPGFDFNFLNSYRKWLYQGNDRAMKCWHAHILQILKECDEFHERLYPCESAEFIAEHLSKVSMDKLTKRYNGNKFNAEIEANR